MVSRVVLPVGIHCFLFVCFVFLNFIYFFIQQVLIHIGVYMSIPISQFIPHHCPPPSPLSPPWCPYVCSLHLCPYFCPANRFICTIFLGSTYRPLFLNIYNLMSLQCGSLFHDVRRELFSPNYFNLISFYAISIMHFNQNGLLFINTEKV